MHSKKWCALWCFLLIAGPSAFAQSSPYVITDFPLAAIGADSAISIKWSGVARPGQSQLPDSGDIYYSRSPGGSKIQNYYKVTPYSGPAARNNAWINGQPQQRETIFRPIDQTDMSAGVFYCMVARAFSYTNPITHQAVRDTFYSNELPLIVETSLPTELVSPTDTIEDLTPTFVWKVNPGVPYYHVLLSDEKIAVDTANGDFSVAGLSVIWQAITAQTQIVYGAPDPSGTITASPPPLSPGKTYSVVVLNNYGNHPAYTSKKVGFPKTFTIIGDTLKKPHNISPNDTTIDAASTIRFKWTNLDSRANTYRVYVYVASNMANIGAQLVVWENEVTAGNFAGKDTAWLDINAQSVLTENHYTWKAIAVDSKGAGSAGDTTSFDYTSPTGTVVIQTQEQINVGGSVLTANVAAVEIKVEVLSGSLEKPLLFYTDDQGYLERERPAGTYRITAHKRGFDDLTRTITVTDGQTTENTLIMKRPDATVFGKVYDNAGLGIDLARVVAVSERGDTVLAETDKFGNFILSCYAADWDIWAHKTGYITALSRDTSVAFGQSVDFGQISLQKVPFTLSGVVKNSQGQPVIGARVVLSQQGTTIDEIPSTSQNGSFSFSASAGTYTLTSTKTGFTSVTRSIDLVASTQLTITMQAGAALATGYVIGTSNVFGRTTTGPITGAHIYFARIRAISPDTLAAITDATYGDYRISLPPNDSFSVWSSAMGYAADAVISKVITGAGATVQYNDTLRGLAMIHGTAWLENKQTHALSGNLSDVSITLINPVSGTIIGSGKTQSNGVFEIRGIPDGKFAIHSGKEEYVLDSIAPSDTITITGGIPNHDSLGIFLSAGDKRITWSVTIGTRTNQTDCSIKLQSPFQKVLAPRDTLKKAGSGDYVVVVDAVSRSVLDLSYHKFTVQDTQTIDRETLVLPVSHTEIDSVSIPNDTMEIVLRSAQVLDSVILYYKDIAAPSFASRADTGNDSVYTFALIPPRDGSTMLYYFRAFKGEDVWGYSQETFRTYIRPTSKLTKIEIAPGAGDTLVYPAGYAITFGIQAYFGSMFARDSSLSGANVTWEIANEQGCKLSARGLAAQVTTGALPTGSPVALTATVDDSLVKIGVSNTATIYFTVSNKKVTSILITRLDPGNPNPISTSPGDRAEFKAEGIDSASGTILSLTPQWSRSPTTAGVISSNGVFTPARIYAGFVKISASISTGSSAITGEYNANESNPLISGLQVMHVLVHKSTRDTMSNADGCTVIFPDSVVGPGETGKLSIQSPKLTNVVSRGLGDFKVLGNAYDIDEINNVAFKFHAHDSLRLVLKIPESYQERARGETSAFSIGYWNADSLRWELLANSAVASDGKTISAGTLHLSRYAVMASSASVKSQLSIVANPFSPYSRKVPANCPPAPPQASGGTWIRLVASSSFAVSVRLQIFNVVGDRVYSLQLQSVTPQVPYYVWWDGKSSDSDLNPAPFVNNAYYAAGKYLCRNGRYIVVLTIKDAQDKTKNLMKQAVLIK